jgi:eukaryotic-like serine/threonine-protein kinase
MPTVDPVDFTRLAEAISDGDAVDWAAAGSQASPSDRRVLDALKVVSEIAGLHRTMPPSAGERPAELFAGDVWSHLTLREVIGRGAYGVVYRAWDPQLDREVALKLISESAQRDQAMIVVDEGRLLAKVRHRGVVTVFGAARADGFAGLWMELIQGATFEEIIQQQGRFSAREAALFGAEVCEALAAVHSAGLLHRDVKAQNVMRDRSGRVVLMDFGTGRLRELPDEAAVADLAGTPLYMAPELFAGGSAATQTDVYSVGVLLFRLVTGGFPLPARSLAEVRLGHEQNRVRRLRDERSDLPSAFVSIVERALARDPAHRYASAGELELALTGFLATSAELSAASSSGSGGHLLGRPAQTVVPVQPTWADRIRRLLPAAAMLALGVAAGVAAAMAWLPPRVAPAPTVRFMITPPGNEDFLSFSLAPDGSQVAFGARASCGRGPSPASRPGRSPTHRVRTIRSGHRTAGRSPISSRTRCGWRASAEASRVTCARPGTPWAARGALTAPFSSPRISAAPSIGSPPRAASASPSDCRASTAPTCAGRRSCRAAGRRSSTRRGAQPRSRGRSWPAGSMPAAAIRCCCRAMPTPR